MLGILQSHADSLDLRLVIKLRKKQLSVFLPRQPFSNGLVTVMVPQLRRENSLLLWSTLDLNSPVHAFVGHDDVVLEFQWRPQKEGETRRRDGEKQSGGLWLFSLLFSDALSLFPLQAPRTTSWSPGPEIRL